MSPNTYYADPNAADVVTTTFAPATSYMTFSIPTGDNYLFREPTLLITPNIPTGSKLSGPTTKTSLDLSPAYFAANSRLSRYNYLGFPIGSVPLGFNIPKLSTYLVTGSGSTTSATYMVPTVGVTGWYNAYQFSSPTVNIATDYGVQPWATYALQYQDSNSNWITYDQKFVPILLARDYLAPPVCIRLPFSR